MDMRKVFFGVAQKGDDWTDVKDDKLVLWLENEREYVMAYKMEKLLESYTRVEAKEYMMEYPRVVLRV